MSDNLTKDQIRANREKEAIASMKLARDNMASAISRISTLESCMANFSALYDEMIKHVCPESYVYNGNKSCRERFAERKAEIMKNA